jgi:hypothetical protein
MRYRKICFLPSIGPPGRKPGPRGPLFMTADAAACTTSVAAIFSSDMTRIGWRKVIDARAHEGVDNHFSFIIHIRKVKLRH